MAAQTEVIKYCGVGIGERATHAAAIKGNSQEATPEQ